MGVDWANLSVGVAAILGLIYVVREMRGIHKDSDAIQSHQTDVLRDVAVTLSTVSERVDRLHDDNVETAIKLKSADRTADRKAKAKVVEE